PDDVPAPCRVRGLDGASILQIAVGLFHTLFLVEEEGTGRGMLFSAGANEVGQLGRGGTDLRMSDRSPCLVPALSGENVLCVAAGWDFSLAILEGGKVVGWGWDRKGQLGMGIQVVEGAGGCKEGYDMFCEPRVIELPEEQGGAARATVVACGSLHCMIATEGGRLYACGSNSNGQLGLGDKEDRRRMTRVSFFDGCEIRKIACGDEHTLVLLTNGTLFGFGKNQLGQLG
ncbi:hypothetical protein GUITHDRAFT_48795, partial [Guillardia theta CCMP2712]